MAVRKYYDLVRVGVTGTPGTGSITLGSAISGFLTFAQGGVSNGEVVTYAINDQGQSEIGYGTYTAAGTSLSRDTVLSSTNGGLNGAKISVTATAQVFIAMSARDQAGLSRDNTWTGTNIFNGASTFNAAVAITAGGIAITGDSTLAGAFAITSTSANALAVGRQGSTNPVLQVDASAATVVTGIKITGGATGSNTSISVISSGANETLTIDAKGNGLLTLASTSTGIVAIGNSSKWAVDPTTGFMGIGGSIGAIEAVTITTVTGKNHIRLKNSSGPTTGTLINQLSTGQFQFNNQDNSTVEFYTNNGSGEQFILGTAGNGLKIGGSAPAPGAAGLGVQGNIVTPGALLATLSTNAVYTPFTATNTNAGAAAVVNVNFAVMSGGSFLLNAASAAGGDFAIVRWTGGGGLFLENLNANGTVTIRTGAGPTAAITVGNTQFVQVANPMSTGGWSRCTADFSKTSDTTLANVTGLSVTVQAGVNYDFDVYLSWTDAAAGGVKAAIAGTATATSIIYDGYVIESNAIKAQTNAAALGTTVASTVTVATNGMIRIHGTITVNAAGTLTVQFAQNTSNGTASTVKRGSYFNVYATVA